MKVAVNIADNIITSLGMDTARNMESIGHGHSGITFHPDRFHVPEPIFASVVPFEKVDEYFRTFAGAGQFTDFEKVVICSVHEAATRINFDLSSPDTLFVISTTKGNVSLLDPAHKQKFKQERVHLWAAAEVITSFFHNLNTPVVVSQACISGVSAILVARMFLETGRYRHIVVTGGDVLSKFIVSGFQSFKALSQGICRPFDASRDGLSLGEGAATIIFSIAGESELPPNSIAVKTGAISNDANHISGPSRTAEGLFRALTQTFNNNDPASLAFINAHGTGTPYNDEMEAVAISRAGLEMVPVNSLKGYFGHTLGAAGIIETIVCMHSLKNSQLVKSLGFTSSGVSRSINMITGVQGTEGTECLKLASGFGGCNAVVRIKKY